jgi:group I intron endonuclease
MAETMIGLYAIVNKANRMAYVGSSNDIKRRLKEHRTALKLNRHHCRHLQNAWNKYGDGSFEAKQIASVESLDYARELEQAFLECFIDKLYNSKTTAIGFASGNKSPAKRPDWHMKTVMQRLSPEERKARYGKTKGTKRASAPYVQGAEKRLKNPGFTKKLSEACKGKRALVTCPHCGLSGGGGNMRRYHFEKCAKR